jgi:hypothetical protein
LAHYTEDELTLYHYGEIAGLQRVEQHLQECELCAATYRDLARTLACVSDLHVPGRDERYGLEVWQRVRADLQSPAPRWAAWMNGLSLIGAARAGAIAALLVLAFVAGRTWPPPTPLAADADRDVSLVELRRELREMRQMLTLSLLQQQSASERLRGVSRSTQIDEPDGAVVRALLDTLRHDPNVNVRLASVEALRRFGAEAQVRQEAIQALTDWSFPLVQIALIDFVVELKDHRAADVLRQLMEDERADDVVRSRAAWGLERISS